MNSQLEDLLDRLGSLVSALLPSMGRRMSDAFRAMALTLLRGISNTIADHSNLAALNYTIERLRQGFADSGGAADWSKSNVEELRSDYSKIREEAGLLPFAWARAAWQTRGEESRIIEFPAQKPRQV